MGNIFCPESKVDEIALENKQDLVKSKKRQESQLLDISNYNEKL